MKSIIKFLKSLEIELMIFMWVIGIGLFYSLLIICQSKFNYNIGWRPALHLAVIAGFIWTIIAVVLSKKDEKIAKGEKAIKDAVASVFQNKKK